MCSGGTSHLVIFLRDYARLLPHRFETSAKALLFPGVPPDNGWML
jgi:hypothetical protein